jgi:hypothetical protein
MAEDARVKAYAKRRLLAYKGPKSVEFVEQFRAAKR